MAGFNAEFWEIQAGQGFMESLPAERALWFETDEDRHYRHAMHDFYQEVRPVVREMLDSQLTRRQSEVMKLYFLYDKTQEDIAIILEVTQSTVSRHLNGTMRRGKKVGGAIPKLKKAVEKSGSETVNLAFDNLRSELAKAG